MVYGIACALLTFTVLHGRRTCGRCGRRDRDANGAGTTCSTGFVFVVAQEARARRDFARPVRRVVRRRDGAVAGVRRPTFCTSDSVGLGVLRAAPGVSAPRSSRSGWDCAHPASRRSLDVRRRRRVRRRNDCLRPVDQLLAVARRAGGAGAGDMVSVFVRSLLVQLETPDAIRGRVSAVNSMFIGASNELGEFESGVDREMVRDRALRGARRLRDADRRRESYMQTIPRAPQARSLPRTAH